jgi:carbamoyl-phosphate synthase large subunit
MGMEVGFPLVVRPSYVLGGRAMEIVHNEDDLRTYMREAVQVSNESPVLLDRFLEQAVEVDVDAICDGEAVLVGGIMEHIEQAGIHSGDSGCSLPPATLTAETQEELRVQTITLARAMNVVGLMNIQFAIQNGVIYLLEVNPRASRSVPFVSKATGMSLAKIAAKAMVGMVFPFAKFPEADPILGPEMKSTGEVMGTGRSFAEAYAKAQLASGVMLPHNGTALLSVRDRDKPGVVKLAKILTDRGFHIVATDGTACHLAKHGILCRRVNKVREGRPHIVDMIKNSEIIFIVNTTEGKQAIRESHSIRGAAVHQKITYYTTMAAAIATSMALDHLDGGEVNKLQDLHREVMS